MKPRKVMTASTPSYRAGSNSLYDQYVLAGRPDLSMFNWGGVRVNWPYLPTKYEAMCLDMHERNQRVIMIHEADGDFL